MSEIENGIEETGVGSVTISASDLAIALGATIPFAGREDDLPAVQTIRLAAQDGVLTATSTDRYAASYARRYVTGELPPIYIHVGDARMLRRMARGGDRNTLVTVDAAAGKVNFGINSRTITVDGSGDSHCRKTFVTIDNVLADLPDRLTSQLDGMVALNPWLLARVAKMVGRLGQRPDAVRFYFAAPMKPVRLEYQGWWLGVLMPVRLASDVENVPTPPKPPGEAPDG